MADQQDTIETSEKTQQEQEQRQREEALRALTSFAQSGSQTSYDNQFAGLAQMMSGGGQQGALTPQLVEALLESWDREARHNYDYAREQIRSFSKVVYPWLATQSVLATIAQVIPSLVPMITDQVTKQVTDRLIQHIQQNPSWFQQAVQQSSSSSK